MRAMLVLATTVPPQFAAGLAAHHEDTSASAQVVNLAGESWAIQPLSRVDDVTLLALGSIDVAAAGQTVSASSRWKTIRVPVGNPAASARQRRT